ncbi:hypothetical protein GCM10010327_50320 [Streptomyces nitrosporeus]|nr:hypothetical protein GCM10010327_50320 [Streptomyces nitrosporeus]
MTQLREVGTLKPCAWGVPGLSVRVFGRTVSPYVATVICAPSAPGQELAVSDTPDRVGRWVFQVSFTNGTQKPEK